MIVKKITYFSIFFLIIATLVLISRGNFRKNEENKLVLTNPQNNKGFAESLNNSGQFYKIFREALDSEERGDKKTAIKLFNDCVPRATIGIERGMVYYELIKIYHDLGDLEQELKYSELLPRYSMNQKDNQEAMQRAEEIRKILGSQSADTPKAPPLNRRRAGAPQKP